MIIRCCADNRKSCGGCGNSVDAAGWQIVWDEVMARIAGRFTRVEPRRTARQFLTGLLLGIERKNCWQLAEHAGSQGTQRMPLR
jgi:hypothetical protein